MKGDEALELKLDIGKQDRSNAGIVLLLLAAVAGVAMAGCRRES